MRSKSLMLNALVAVLIAAACTGGSAAEDKPAIMRAVDGIPGWTRAGDAETYTKDGLYGYIDGGAEIVLQYGFRELAVFKFKPAEASTALAAAPSKKEIVLEIYRMGSGLAAFGLFSMKLEGEETGWPGIDADHWIGAGQGGLVKGEYVVNILAPESTDQEIGEFAAALAPKIPGKGTARPKGLDWLPRGGMVFGSWHYVRGTLAAQSESPFLEPDVWGFGLAGEDAAEAYSAKYGKAPAISKLVIVKLGQSSENGMLEEKVLAVFREYLRDVRREGDLVEGQNDVGRWFLFRARGRVAVLVLGEPDRQAGLERLDLAFLQVLR